MKNKSFLSIILIFIFSNVNGQFLTEASLEQRANQAKNDMKFEEIKGYGFSSDIPSSFSLEKYAVVSNQKDASSCTGYAIAGAMNIMYNYLNGITNVTEQLANRFDPEYIYCALKDDNDINCISGDGCGCGSYIYEGIELVKEYGCKKLGLDPYLKCATTLNKTILRKLSPITRHYSIDYAVSFVDWKRKNGIDYYKIDIEGMKEAISYGLPLITGIFTPEEFNDLAMVYAPAKGETGPHAITIVGYDDNYLGGAFRVLNSYGRDWGDNGFFWLKYDDLKNNFASSGVFLLMKEDADFSSWIEEVKNPDFYKGELTSGKYWEGPMNEDYNCHGTGILRGDDYSAIATYDEGIPNGWWIVWEDGQDSFWGWLLFEDGKLIEEEAFGFVTEENQLIINNTRNIILSKQGPDIDFIEKIEDDVIDNGIKNNKNKFNYNKKNNYKK